MLDDVVIIPLVSETVVSKIVGRIAAIVCHVVLSLDARAAAVKIVMG
jgi:hypothetical protein